MKRTEKDRKGRKRNAKEGTGRKWMEAGGNGREGRKRNEKHGEGRKRDM